MFDCEIIVSVSCTATEAKTERAHSNDTIRLDEHVVYRRGDGTRPDAVRVRRRPRDLNWVHVRVPRDERDDGEVHPLRRLRVERVERDEERERPDLQEHGGDRAAVDHLAELAEDEEEDHPEEFRRDTEQVGLSRGEAEVAQGEREVGLGRVDGDWYIRKQEFAQYNNLVHVLKWRRPRM